MKKTITFFSLIFLLTISIFSVYALGVDRQPFTELSRISRRFGLTGLCLSTESRHTRHLLFAGEMAAFQDIPGWMDHFPSSTFIFPPRGFLHEEKAAP